MLIMFSYQNPHTEPQTVHAERKQYTCDVCKKSFAVRKAFRDHWRARHQGSQYSCNVCDKSFYDKSNLRKHERLHTGQFSCSVRSKS